MGARSLMTRRSRHAARPWSWHEAMMNEGPAGFIRNQGAETWDHLHAICQRMMAQWDAAPLGHRLNPYPNPEDRRSKP